jgi:hypothetical protein
MAGEWRTGGNERSARESRDVVAATDWRHGWRVRKIQAQATGSEILFREVVCAKMDFTGQFLVRKCGLRVCGCHYFQPSPAKVTRLAESAAMHSTLRHSLRSARWLC